VNVPALRGRGSRESAKPSSRSGSSAGEVQAAELFISQASTAHRDDGMAFLRLLEPTTPGSRPSSGKSPRSTPTDASVPLLEGGYDLDVLGRCVAAHLGGLGSCSAAVAPPCSSARECRCSPFSRTNRIGTRGALERPGRRIVKCG